VLSMIGIAPSCNVPPFSLENSNFKDGRLPRVECNP
jgi:hypothetical protein